MESPRAERRIHGLLRLCLLTWPRDRRIAHGSALLDTVERRLADVAPRGRLLLVREFVAECAAIGWAGLGMRLRTNVRLGRELTLGWVGDLRMAFRGLLRSPGFATVTVVTLGLGIGANVTVFSLVDRVLLQAPGYVDPEALMLVWNTLPGSDARVPMAAPDVAILRERATRLEGFAFTDRVADGSISLGEAGNAEHVRHATVTVDFFDVLGVQPALGRTFRSDDGATDAADDGQAAAPAVVLSDGLWRRMFAASPVVLGLEIRLDGRPAIVVGVMPPDFRLLLPPDAGIETDIDVWTPLPVPLSSFQRTADRILDQDSDNTGGVIARLVPGATRDQARAELGRIAIDLQNEIPEYAVADLGLTVRPLLADATDHARRLLMALLVGAGVVLLVACLNIATLLLARGMARQGEMALRAALGAGRLRIVRQLLAESLVLVFLGAAAAVLLASAGLSAFGALVPPTLASPVEFGMDGRAFLFAAVLTGGAALVFGLLPAIQTAFSDARGSVGAMIVRSAPGRGRAREALVAAQVALTVVLSLGAGLLLRTVSALQDVRPGFEAQGALTFRLSLRVPGRYRGPADRARFLNEVERAVLLLPGVTHVGLTGVLPLGGDRWTQPFGLPGQAEPEWQENRADFRVISSGYFDALGTRLLEGRSFTAHEDLNEDERVVVVDKRLADRIAPVGSALDATVGIPIDGSAIEARVVGVVEDIRSESLDADGREAIYVPYRQEASRDVAFVVRTTGDPLALVPSIQRELEELDSQLPVYGLRTLEDYVSEAIAPRSFTLLLLGGFALLSLLSAAIGLYGVVAFEVNRRTHDIGLRMAVGATRRSVVWSILARGLMMGGAGLAAGAVLAFLVSGGLRSVLYGVRPADPLTWLAVVALVAGVTLTATWIPALRASRLDPNVALRAE